MRNFHLQNSTN